jgi:hypothetical protein
MTSRKPTFLILFLLVLACLGTNLAFTVAERQAEEGELGVPIDDAWIHYRFAQNLATGYGFSYNPDYPVPGSTSPLWVLLLTLLYPVTHEFLLTSKILGVLFEVLTTYLIYFLALRLEPSRIFALGVALVKGLTGRMTWGALSGMEVTLFAFLSLLGIFLYLRSEENPKAKITAAFIFGLATQARPEGYLLFVLFVLDQIGEGLALARTGRARWAKLARTIGLEVLVYSLVALPYILFALATTGRPMPATYYAKKGLGLIIPTRSWRYLTEAFGFWLAQDNKVLIWFLPLGLIRLLGKTWRGKERILGIWFVGFFLVSAMVMPSFINEARYILPLVPIFILLGLLGVVQVTTWLRKIKLDFLLPKIGMSFLTVLVILSSTGYALARMNAWESVYVRNVDNINKMQVAMGKWAKENIPPQSLVALNDIGATIYFSNLRCLDTFGLISPELLSYLREYAFEPGGYRKGIWLYLKERRPDYLIIFPDLYPEFPESPVLEPVYQIEYPNNTGGGNLMVVYKTYWEREGEKGIFP